MNDRELKRVAREYRQGMLEGAPSDMMCFALCFPLQGYLGFLGVHTKLVEADFGRCNHYWLKLEDGRILDPTADQFSGKSLKLPKVYLGPIPEVYLRWMAEAKKAG